MWVGISTAYTILGERVAPKLVDLYLGRTGSRVAADRPGRPAARRRTSSSRGRHADRGAHGPFDGRPTPTTRSCGCPNTVARCCPEPRRCSGLARRSWARRLSGALSDGPTRPPGAPTASRPSAATPSSATGARSRSSPRTAPSTGSRSSSLDGHPTFARTARPGRGRRISRSPRRQFTVAPGVRARQQRLATVYTGRQRHRPGDRLAQHRPGRPAAVDRVRPPRRGAPGQRPAALAGPPGSGRSDRRGRGPGRPTAPRCSRWPTSTSPSAPPGWAPPRSATGSVHGQARPGRGRPRLAGCRRHQRSRPSSRVRGHRRPHRRHVAGLA